MKELNQRILKNTISHLFMISTGFIAISCLFTIIWNDLGILQLVGLVVICASTMALFLKLMENYK